MLKPKSMPARRWLRVNEAAEYLGVHPVSIRRGISKGDIPAAKIKSVGWRVDGSRLDAILEAACGPKR
ncbi:MAG: helix-turn-helix domain-containing protein [Acidobacteriota bacterium]